MGTPVQGQVIRCIALKRPSKDYGDKLPDWLLCTGINMGRWTAWFGPWCLAGDGDARKFVENNHEMNSGTTIVEFEIHCTSSLLPTLDIHNQWICQQCKTLNTLSATFNPDNKCERCGHQKGDM
jgi:hypothetical protein